MAIPLPLHAMASGGCIGVFGHHPKVVSQGPFPSEIVQFLNYSIPGSNINSYAVATYNIRENKRRHKRHEKLIEALQLVTKYSEFDLSVGRIVEEVGVNQQTLGRVFHEVLGVTAKEFLRTYKAYKVHNTLVEQSYFNRRSYKRIMEDYNIVKLDRFATLYEKLFFQDPVLTLLAGYSQVQIKKVKYIFQLVD